MKVFGIDVSYWQGGDIDWAKAKASGVEFVFIRVGNRGLSKGTISKDVYFERNIKGALANGIKVGIYFYSSSISEAEAIEEANFVIKELEPYKDQITMPVCFDYEGFGNANNRNYGMTKEKITANCIAFQKIIKANGYSCILYGSQYYLPKKFDLKKLTDYLWVAKYTSKEKVISDDAYKPKVSGYDDRIAIWQCASCGKVDGIKGRVDIDYMYIDVSKKEETEEEKKEDVNPIKMYAKGKAVQLAKNFKSTEFDCHGKGCCTETPIHSGLVEILQQARDYFGKSIKLNCGYRCEKHNANVSGASKNSQHTKGLAVDIVVNKGKVHPVIVARYFEKVFEERGIKGRIGCYSWDDKGGGFVHIDVRGTDSRAFYTENNTEYDKVTSFHSAIRRGDRGRDVIVIQRRLKSRGYYTGEIDGSCGEKTEKAILAWNESHVRLDDAVWGRKCWNEAFPF